MGELKYFFSYARKDSEFVLKLAQDLRAAGVNLWLDQIDILGGRQWDQEVERALKFCQGMIAVLSPESVASDNVMNEVSYALEEGRLVVPVLIQPCDKPFRLRRLQHIDFTAGYDTGFSQLLKALSIEQPSQPPEPGPPERSFIREVKEPFGDRPVEPPIPELSSIRMEPFPPEHEPITPTTPESKPVKIPEVMRRSRAILIGVPAGLVILFLMVGLWWFISTNPLSRALKSYKYQLGWSNQDLGIPDNQPYWASLEMPIFQKVDRAIIPYNGASGRGKLEVTLGGHTISGNWEDGTGKGEIEVKFNENFGRAEGWWNFDGGQRQKFNAFMRRVE